MTEYDTGRSRRGVWVLVALAVVALAAVLLPGSARPPELQLVALDGTGRFSDSVYLPAAAADAATHVIGAVARVPLVLGVRNTGASPAAPGRLELSLPHRVRVTDARGTELPGIETPGSPLARYAFDATFPAVLPDRLPELLPGLDTLWLEVVVPAFYCVTLADSVPEFIPAPAPAPETLASVRIFYVFEGGGLRRRHTGVLNLAMDPAIVHRRPVPPVAPGPPGPPGPEPDTLGMQRVGSRASTCGDATSAIALRATLWRAPGGGRLFTVAHGGRVRKIMYDEDADGFIERETWDADGDGRMDRGRVTRLPIPESLVPLPTSEAPPEGPPAGQAVGPPP